MSERRAELDRASPEDTAVYIAAMAAELAELARNAGLGTLAYLLDIASLEADETRHRLAAAATAG